MKTKSNPELSAFLKRIGNYINEDTWPSIQTIVLGNNDSSFYQIILHFYDLTHFMILFDN